MKKVLIIANDTTYTYNLRKEIIDALLEKQYEVIIVSEILKFASELEKMGCKLVDVKVERQGKNPFSDIKLFKHYKSIIKKFNPDIVFTYNIKPNIYGGFVCSKLNIPYFPNITGLGTAVEYPGILQKITIRLYKYSIKNAKCIFFQNEANREFFLKYKIINDSFNTILLPGSGVNLTKHYLMDYPKSKNTVFLFIARILKEKGIDLYLEAAKEFSKSNTNTKFYICGKCDDENYKDILSSYMKEGIIQYFGEQKDLLPFFKEAYCIVLPSYYPEGISNVLLEASSHGRPIITTDRSGCRETVDNNVSGYIIPIKNQDSLNSAIRSFLNLTWEEKKEMGLQGRKRMEELFNRDIVVKKYLEEIDK